MEVKVIRAGEARVFMDGPEVCREYEKTGKLTFGTSTLLPGQTGGFDPGHPKSHEIFYVSRGQVLMHIPETSHWYELSEGDIILIPEIKVDIAKVCEAIRNRHRRGKSFSIVVIAQGTIIA